MRLHAYPADISDPHSKFLVLLLLRLTYGDVMASCVLELIMKELIAPTCLTDLAKDILVNLRYIDDMVGGSHSEEELLLALQDLQNALANFNFSMKIVYTNSPKINSYLNPDDIQSDQAPASFFHHSWLPHQDTLSYPLVINVFPKHSQFQRRLWADVYSQLVGTM